MKSQAKQTLRMLLLLTGLAVTMFLLSACLGAIRPEDYSGSPDAGRMPLAGPWATSGRKPAASATVSPAASQAASPSASPPAGQPLASEAGPVRQRMRVTFTFDDGPEPTFTPRILDVLERHRVRAAFFVIGQRVDANPRIVARMAQAGHLVLNHTYTHPLDPDMTRLDEAQIRSEVERADAAIMRITHVRPAYFRAPGGALNDLIAATVGRPTVQWTVEGADWRATDDSEVFNNIYGHLQDKSIILMHDNHDVTVRALDRLLTAMTPDRFEILRLDDYLAAVGS